MELKPCPFLDCQSPAVEIATPYPGGQGSYNAMCLSCGAGGPDGDTEEEAMQKWNNR